MTDETNLDVKPRQSDNESYCSSKASTQIPFKKKKQGGEEHVIQT
jgi:hypothetical protein